MAGKKQEEPIFCLKMEDFCDFEMKATPQFCKDCVRDPEWQTGCAVLRVAFRLTLVEKAQARTNELLEELITIEKKRLAITEEKIRRADIVARNKLGDKN